LIYGGSEQFPTCGCLHIRPNIFNSEKMKKKKKKKEKKEKKEEEKEE